MSLVLGHWIQNWHQSVHVFASAQAFYPRSSALTVNMAEGMRWSKEGLNSLMGASSLSDPQNRAGARAPLNVNISESRESVDSLCKNGGCSLA